MQMKKSKGDNNREDTDVDDDTQNTQSVSSINDSFVSEVYEMVEMHGLLNKLEPGDEVMADKKFKIQDLLVQYGVHLIPSVIY